LLNDFCTIC